MRVLAAPVIALGVLFAGCSENPTAPRGPFPTIVALPDGFSPEGMAFGTGTTVYVGSIMTGAVWRGDVRGGTGKLLVPETADRSATGIKYDDRTRRLFVAGGMTGQAYVYDASTGATLASYQLATPAQVQAGETLVNDVVVLRDAVYFTESFQPVIYRLPLGKDGKLPAAGAVQVVPLGGEYTFVPGGAFNATGIAATPDGRWLILMNSEDGTLYRVDPGTGRASRVALGSPLTFGDGIILDGRTLFVVQSAPDQVSVVHMSADYGSAAVERVITDSNFAFPTALGELGNALYVLNGRFDVAPPGVPAPGVEFQLVRLAR